MAYIVIINQEGMGIGDAALGSKLMGAFLKKLWAREEKPEAICFYNSGVKLLTQGSFVLDALSALESSGVDLLACGTCLDAFGITDALQVGMVSNMEAIVDQMIRADKVITL